MYSTDSLYRSVLYYSFFFGHHDLKHISAYITICNICIDLPLPIQRHSSHLFGPVGPRVPGTSTKMWRKTL